MERNFELMLDAAIAEAGWPVLAAASEDDGVVCDYYPEMALWASQTNDSNVGRRQYVGRRETVQVGVHVTVWANDDDDDNQADRWLTPAELDALEAVAPDWIARHISDDI